MITKHDGTGGAVTVDTVTAQLVYEIRRPVTSAPTSPTDLDTMSSRRTGRPGRDHRRRRAAAAVSTKVCLNYLGGFRNSAEFLLTGLDVEAKAARRGPGRGRARRRRRGPTVVEWPLDRTDAPDPHTEEAGTSLLRCHRAQPGGRPGRPRVQRRRSIELALASYPGFSVTAAPAPARRSASTARRSCRRRTCRTSWSSPTARASIIEPPTDTTDELEPSGSRPSPYPAADWARDPAGCRSGTFVHAPSGDKGGDANLGVWIRRRPSASRVGVTWLADFLDADTVRDLLPEAAELDVEIHPLPNLGGVNVVIHGLLGEGVASSTAARPAGQGARRVAAARDCAVPTAYVRRELRRDHASTRRSGWRCARARARVHRARGRAEPRPVGGGRRAAARAARKQPRKPGSSGVAFPEEVGGQGGDTRRRLRRRRGRARRRAARPAVCSPRLFTHGIAIPHIVAERQRRPDRPYVRPTLAGEMIGSLGITEPGAGSDVANIAHPRGARRRRLRRQRRQDVHHLRGAGRLRHHRGAHRRGRARRHQPDRRRQGHARLHRRAASSTRWAGCAPTPRELSYDDVRVPGRNLVGRGERAASTSHAAVRQPSGSGWPRRATPRAALPRPGRRSTAKERETFGKPLRRARSSGTSSSTCTAGRGRPRYAAQAASRR